MSVKGFKMERLNFNKLYNKVSMGHKMDFNPQRREHLWLYGDIPLDLMVDMEVAECNKIILPSEIILDKCLQVILNSE